MMRLHGLEDRRILADVVTQLFQSILMGALVFLLHQVGKPPSNGPKDCR